MSLGESNGPRAAASKTALEQEAERQAEVERRRKLGDPMLSLVEPLLERCRKAGKPYVDDTFGGAGVSVIVGAARSDSSNPSPLDETGNS